MDEEAVVVRGLVALGDRLERRAALRDVRIGRLRRGPHRVERHPHEAAAVDAHVVVVARLREQALVERTVGLGLDRVVLERFEARAAASPALIAVICDNEELSYGELNRRANEVAHRLRSMGVGAGVVAGICTERSIEMVVGLMGLLKAGSAYLPLDPTYPAERLSFMLENARATVLLTQQRLVEKLGHQQQAEIVCLDGPWPGMAPGEDENVRSGVTPDDLVYVIYTSGSTGQPKGVMLNHRGRVNNFSDFNRRFSVREGDRLLALSSLSFDMCAYDVFGTLAAGATIVLPVAARTLDPSHWADLMVRHKVSLWHSVPALLELLVE